MIKEKKRSIIATRWFWILIAVVVWILVVLYLWEAEDSIDIQQTIVEAPLPLVSYEPVSIAPATARVSAYAEVQPRWSAELKAAVSGRVIQVTENALSGERVAKGTVLVTLEDSRYQAEKGAAQLAVKEARLELSRAKKNTEIEKKLFAQTGVKPPNDFALHLPQLEIAESALKLAQSRLVVARQQLSDATIRAPFSAFIAERNVSPGQMVNPGDSLLKLVDDRDFELVVGLSRTDWLLVKQPLAGAEAKILNQPGEVIGTAIVRSAGGFLDQKTRLYQIFLELKREKTGKILSGDFIRVQLPGVTVPKAINIPASAYTAEGFIWYLDTQNRLQRISPEVLFRSQERLIIKAPKTLSIERIAITPLASFLPGIKVNPMKIAHRLEQMWSLEGESSISTQPTSDVE